jgi:hypothetical protein
MPIFALSGTPTGPLYRFEPRATRILVLTAAGKPVFEGNFFKQLRPRRAPHRRVAGEKETGAVWDAGRARALISTVQFLATSRVCLIDAIRFPRLREALFE